MKMPNAPRTNRSLDVINQKHLQEGMNTVLRITADLGFTRVENAALFGGYARTDAEAENFLKSLQNLPSQDIQDRIDYFIDITSKLNTIFGNNVQEQNKYFHTKQETLGNKSPIELIKSRHQHELVHLISWLTNITGE